MTRCPSCGARDFRRTERSPENDGSRCRECSHCGLLADPVALQSGAVAAFLGAHVVEGPFVSRPSDPVFVESYALRTLALSRGLLSRPVGDEQREALHDPYRPLAAAAELLPLSEIDPAPVSLVMLCRPANLELLAKVIAALVPRFADVILVLDAEVVPSIPELPERVRILPRPLAGDFAAQRNVGQALARHDWVLQLDADESLEESSLTDLGRVAALANLDGALSVGLSRRNRVDGVLSDLYPDVQYRLNRKQVLFEGTVHERPALPRGWRNGFIAPNLVIDHHLTRAHVETRSVRYERLSPGKGRSFEGETLLTPYRP